MKLRNKKITKVWAKYTWRSFMICIQQNNYGDETSGMSLAGLVIRTGR